MRNRLAEQSAFDALLEKIKILQYFHLNFVYKLHDNTAAIHHKSYLAISIEIETLSRAGWTNF